MREIDKFNDLEFTYENRLYYVSGVVYIRITEEIGGSYEGYDHEVITDSEVESIELDEIYYIDEDINDKVDVLGLSEYRDVENEALIFIAFNYI